MHVDETCAKIKISRPADVRRLLLLSVVKWFWGTQWVALRVEPVTQSSAHPLCCSLVFAYGNDDVRIGFHIINPAVKVAHKAAPASLVGVMEHRDERFHFAILISAAKEALRMREHVGKGAT